MEQKGQLDRLLDFTEYCRKQYGLSRFAFEQKCGLARGYFNTRIKKDKNSNKGLNSETVKKVCATFPELNRVWLMTGSGEMLNGSDMPHEVKAGQGSPYFDVDFMGGFDIVFDDMTRTPDSYISMEPFNGKGFMWCNITGDSMSPLIKSGSKICMKQLMGGVEDIIFGEVYALVIGNSQTGDMQRTVKWVTRSDDETKIRLVPENKDLKYGSYQDVKKSDVRMVFKVMFAGTVL